MGETLIGGLPRGGLTREAVPRALKTCCCLCPRRCSEKGVLTSDLEFDMGPGVATAATAVALDKAMATGLAILSITPSSRGHLRSICCSSCGSH